MQIEVSNGELVDKVIILRLKLDKIDDEAKLINIRKELDTLLFYMQQLSIDETNNEYKLLADVNDRLWSLEDFIREKDKAGEFDDAFISTARSIHLFNDLRAQIKRRINTLTDSPIIEEKSYKE